MRKIITILILMILLVSQISARTYVKYSEIGREKPVNVTFASDSEVIRFMEDYKDFITSVREYKYREGYHTITFDSSIMENCTKFQIITDVKAIKEFAIHYKR